MPSPSRPSLHQFLFDRLKSAPTDQPRTFELTTLCTKPFRTHALFPHALDPTAVTTRTDYLVTLAESFEDYMTQDGPPRIVTVPVFALEASLFAVPSTRVQVLYVSKIDTTGLSPAPAPAGHLTRAFLAHFLQNKPRSVGSLRIHVFARAAREGQYLFPASAENAPGGPGDGAKLYAKVASSGSDGSSAPFRPRAGKKILNDQQLVKWWHQTLSAVASEYRASQPRGNLECFYILPGFDEQECHQVLPVGSKQVQEMWSYGHPYNRVPTPLSRPRAKVVGAGGEAHPLLLSELIPAFSDDPKARFLHSIGDCSTSPSGEPGDWDDAVVDRSLSSLEHDRSRERSKINMVSPDEFWDRMGARQECCDGRLSAFFVLALAEPHPSPTPVLPGTSSREDVPRREVVSVSRNVWISLWSKIHNKDYAKLDTAAVGYSGWMQDVRSSINATVVEDQQKKQKIKMTKEGEEETVIAEAVQGRVEDAGRESLDVEAAQRTDTRGEEAPPPSLCSSFDSCHSVVVIVGNTRTAPPGDLPQPAGTAALASAEQNGSANHTAKRSIGGAVGVQGQANHVNELQPRKKPKKMVVGS